jgi:hypothetical protein
MPSISTLTAIVLAAFVTGLGIGYGVTHQQVSLLNSAIEQQSREAQEKLDAAKKRVTESQEKAITANNDLDKSHEAFIQTANAYDKQRDSLSLYSERRPCSGSTETTGDTPRVSQETTSEAELDAETNRIIKEAAVIADIAADYADKAYQFASINNCGIVRD